MDSIFKMADIVADRLKRNMLRDVIVINQKITEKDVIVGFRYESDTYEYKLSSSGVTRKIDKNFLDYDDLSVFEDFFEDLRSRLFSGNEPGQVSLFDYDKQHDEKVIHELSDEEGQELNKLVDDIQSDDEKEQLDNNVNSENLNASISNNDKTLKDDTNIIESENVVKNVSKNKIVDIGNINIKMPTPTPKHCEKCGQVSVELDINNECAECAKEDVFEAGTIPSGFGQSITASF